MVVPARRVQLPWATYSFDVNNLTGDGQALLKASLLWAAGAGSIGDPSLEKVGLSTTATEAGSFNKLSTIMVASPVTLTVKGEMLELSAYIDCNNLPIRLAIYSDGSGKPLTRLAQTGTLTGSAAPAWVTGSIPAIVLNPGTYWLAASLSDNNQNLHYAKPNNFSTSHITKLNFNNGFPATWTPGPFGGLTFTTASIFCIDVFPELQVKQRPEIGAPFENYMTTMTTIATIRATFLHKFFAMKMQTARAAVTGA